MDPILALKQDLTPPPLTLPVDADMAKLSAEAGSNLWKDQRIPAQDRMDHFLKVNAMAGRDQNSVAQDAAKLFGMSKDDVIAKLPTARTEAVLGAYRQQFKSMDREPLTHYIASRSVPFGSAIGRYLENRDYAERLDRYKQGQATDEDLNFIAGYERLNELKAQDESTFGGGVKSAMFSLPAIIGEAAATRGLAVPFRAAAGANAAVQAAKGTAGLAARTAAMPSMGYVDKAQQNAQQYGGNTGDFRNLAPAFAYGMAQNAILGQMQKNIGGSFAGQTAKKTIVAMGEQQIVDTASSGINDAAKLAGYDLHLDTGYGTLGKLVQDFREGKQEGLNHLAVEAVTFGVFSAMHSQPNRVPQAFARTIKALRGKGLSEAKAAEALKPVMDAAQFGDDGSLPDPNNIRKAGEAAKDPAIKDFADSLAESLPVDAWANENTLGSRNLPEGVTLPQPEPTKAPEVSKPVVNPEPAPPVESPKSVSEPKAEDMTPAQWVDYLTERRNKSEESIKAAEAKLKGIQDQVTIHSADESSRQYQAAIRAEKIAQKQLKAAKKQYKDTIRELEDARSKKMLAEAEAIRANADQPFEEPPPIAEQPAPEPVTSPTPIKKGRKGATKKSEIAPPQSKPATLQEAPVQEAAKPQGTGLGDVVDQRLETWNDPSKPLMDRIKALADIDTRVFDPIINSGNHNELRVGHNEVFRRIQLRFSEYLRSGKGPVDLQNLRQELMSTGRRAVSHAEDLRRMASEGKTYGSMTPERMRAAADLYEREYPRAVGEVMAEVSKPRDPYASSEGYANDVQWRLAGADKFYPTVEEVERYTRHVKSKNVDGARITAWGIAKQAKQPIELILDQLARGSGVNLRGEGEVFRPKSSPRAEVVKKASQKHLEVTQKQLEVDVNETIKEIVAETGISRAEAQARAVEALQQGIRDGEAAGENEGSRLSDERLIADTTGGLGAERGESAQPERPDGTDQGSSDRGGSRSGSAGLADAKPGDVVSVKPSEVKVDPARFQFKLNTSKSTGASDELLSVREWNPDFAGILAGWKDPADGVTYVVNGHHRHELANRLGVESIPIRLLDAKNAQEARAKGALINIAEGRGTAIDAAKFMRDMGVSIDDFAKHGVPLKPGALADQAFVLTRLNDKAFDRLARGELDPGKAIAVARHLEDPVRQEKLFKLIEDRENQGREVGLRTTEELSRAMAAAPEITRTENTLWGPEEFTEDAFVQRAELAGFVRSELAKEFSDFKFGASGRRAGRLGEEGNVLNVEANKDRAGQAELAKEVYDRLANRKGPISDALNEGAKKLADAKTKKEKDRVRTETADSVREAIQTELETQRTGKGPAVSGGGVVPESQPAAAATPDAGPGETEPSGLSEDRPSRYLSPNAQLDIFGGSKREPLPAKKAVKQSLITREMEQREEVSQMEKALDDIRKASNPEEQSLSRQERRPWSDTSGLPKLVFRDIVPSADPMIDGPEKAYQSIRQMYDERTPAFWKSQISREEGGGIDLGQAGPNQQNLTRAQVAAFAAQQTDGISRAGRWIADEWHRLGGRIAPAVRRYSEAASDAIARFISVGHYTRLQAPEMIEKVMGKGATEDDRIILGGLLTEMRLRHMRRAYADESLKHAQAYQALVQQYGPNPIDKAIRKAMRHHRAMQDKMLERAKNVRTIVDRPGQPAATGAQLNPFTSESVYRQYLADPRYQQMIANFKQHMVPHMESTFRQYKGMNPTDPINSLTQIPDMPVNLMVGDPTVPGVVMTGGTKAPRRGKLTNQKLLTNKFTLEAKGDASVYVIDAGLMIENALTRANRVAAHATMYRELIKAGVAYMGTAGDVRQTPEGQDYKRIERADPPKNTKLGQVGESELFVRPEIYDEVRRALSVDAPVKYEPIRRFNNIVTQMALASTAEFTYHTRNLLTMMLKPGMNLGQLIHNAHEVIRNSPEARDRLVELARIGALKEKGLESGNIPFPESWTTARKLDPTKHLGKILDFFDKTLRLTADDAFDNLAKRKYLKTDIQMTEANRRDFINQLGQYNRAGQSGIIALIRDLGLGPFATAGSNYFVQGVRGLTGNAGVRSTTTSGAIALRAEMYARAATVLSTALLYNFFKWGNIWGDDDTPLGAIKIADKDNKVQYWDLAGLTGLSRGARATGLMAVAEGLRHGKGRGEIQDHAFHDATHSALHPAMGPTVSFAYTATTGKNTLGNLVAEQKSKATTPQGEARAVAKGRPPSDSSQSYYDIKAAIANMNPSIAALTGQDRLYRHGEEPDTWDRIIKLAGPYGLKERHKEGEKKRR